MELSPPPAPPAPLLRRNGTRYSCEPCRKLKYRCDHIMPVCGRCRRRNIVSQCQYNISPMRAPAPAKANISGTHSLPDHDSVTTTTTATESRVALSHEEPLGEQTSIRLVSPLDPGFQGPTSYSAILTENRDEADWGLILHSPATGVGSNSPTDFDISLIGSRRMRQALAVLELLHSFSMFEEMLGEYHEFEIYTSMIEYFVPSCVDSVRRDIVQAGVLNSPDAQRRTAEVLFQNTCKPVMIAPTCNLADYSNLFTGPSLRWETLAVFFTACGLVCCHWTPRHSTRDNPVKDKYKLLRQLFEASSACVSFCEDAGPLSDLGLWAHYEHVVLSCQVLGYTHYLVWNHAGATTNHIIAQGLHLDSEPGAAIPLWLVEMRRRGVACAYVLDKHFSRLCGRPPRLSQRYCSIHLPRDLEPLQLTAVGITSATSSPENAVNGSKNDGPHQKPYLRCLVMCSKIAEEALELSLGPLQDNLQSRAEDIMRRNQALLASLPPQLRYEGGVDSATDPLLTFKAAQEYLGILHNDFMLQRTLCRHLGTSTAELIRLSHRILSVVLDVSNVRGQSPAMARYAPWINIFFGLPPAGVLALELLQRKRLQATSAPEFAWGQVIQDLSVLVSNLRWIYLPGDANYRLADQARRSLQQILNAVLAEPVNSQSTDVLQNPMDFMEEQDQNMDNFLWLANSGFDTDFWTSLPDNLALS